MLRRDVTVVSALSYLSSAVFVFHGVELKIYLPSQN